MSHRYAIVENDKVTNVLIANENFIQLHYPNAILVDDTVCTGDSYVDGKFFRPEIITIKTDETETL